MWSVVGNDCITQLMVVLKQYTATIDLETLDQTLQTIIDMIFTRLLTAERSG